MADINQLPAGYVGLLDIQQIKGLGAPPIAADFVQPTVDLTHMYALSRQYKVSQVVGNVAAIQTKVEQKIPQEEIWLVHSVSGVAALRALGDYRIGLDVEDVPFAVGGGASSVPITDDVSGVKLAAINSTLNVAYNPGRPIVFGGNTGFVLMLRDSDVADLSGANNVTLEIKVIYSQVSTFAGALAQTL